MKQSTFKFIGASMVALMGAQAMIAPVASQNHIGMINAAEETTVEAGKTEVPAATEDFFEYVNKAYLDSKTMEADEIAIGVNNDLDDQVEKNLKTYLGDLASGKTQPKDDVEQQMLNYYQQVYDFEKREADGTKPVENYFKEIQSLQSTDDLISQLGDWIQNGYPLPFEVYSTPGLDDPNTNQLMIGSGSLILPDTSYYEEGNEDGKALLDAYKTSAEKILVAEGFSKEEAAKHVKNAIEYDALMASYRTPSEERLKTSDNIIPTEKKDVEALTESFKLIPNLEGIIGSPVEKINIDDKKFAGGLKDMMSPDNFEKLQSWMLVCQAEDAAPYLTEDLRKLSAEYDMAQSGAEEAAPQDKAAYQEVIYTWGDVIGNAYGQQYFGDEARKEVEDLTYDVIDMYKVRLESNDWMSPETRKLAIEKLDKMGVMVGYADDYNEATKNYKVNPEKSLYENVVAMEQSDILYSLKSYGQAIPDNQWEMAPFEVNAYYNPNENLICLPAGILQAPFYAKDQSLSANYGGIGNVVGHELTHAFDPSGAEFDANGVYKNWWTEADYKAFDERTKTMIAQFEGLEIYGGKVDGELTVGENVADNGGMVVSLEALKRKAGEDSDFKEYFETYAKTWAIKLRPEYAKMTLTTDEHAPIELRTNIPVQNFEEFYETFGTKKGDKMFMDPEKRLIFW